MFLASQSLLSKCLCCDKVTAGNSCGSHAKLNAGFGRQADQNKGFAYKTRELPIGTTICGHTPEPRDTQNFGAANASDYYFL
jgi:hypothetical protein